MIEINKIYQGDCIELMKKLDENSVDAIITDPPYGIGFMGKEWDNFKPSTIKEGMEEDKRPKTQIASTRVSNIAGTYDLSLSGNKKFMLWWKEVATQCLRVLKPGGFLLSFGGTRTYHRLVCGIEDAGFEIRDTIMWLYGSGFPKSLNIGKQIDKMAEEDLDVIKAKQELGKWLKEKRGDKPQKEISKHFLSKTGGLTGCVANWELGLNLPTWEVWIKLKEVLDLDERYDYLIKGRPKDYIPAEREVIEKKNRTPVNDGSGEVYGTYGSDASITVPATLEAKQWEGWGTALKPACEPIVVARKPLSEKNVALNVLKWGTGGINIDACRIGFEKDDSIIAKNPHTKSKGTENYDTNCYGKYNPTDETIDYKKSQGRFPANIILDEQAGKMLDEQSGIEKGNGKKYFNYENKFDNAMFNAGEEAKGRTRVIRDKGGASRFFYCAKASKSERNFGCEEMGEKNIDYDGRKGQNNSIERPDGSIRKENISKNNHPTVKPIKLMEYLIKLVTREGALVYDPFGGSGTTAIACIKTNRSFILNEKEYEYIQIARARIKPFLEQRKLKWQMNI